METIKIFHDDTGVNLDAGEAGCRMEVQDTGVGQVEVQHSRVGQMVPPIQFRGLRSQIRLGEEIR